MKLIPLTQGKSVKVDDSDFEWLSQWKWFYSTVGYAVRSTVVEGRNTRIYMHRLISETPHKLETDHINQDKLDNRRKNLRNVTSSINKLNKVASSVNTSGYSGIHWFKSRKKWQVYIDFQGKRKHLGYFDKLSSAIRSREEAKESIIIKETK